MILKIAEEEIYSQCYKIWNLLLHVLLFTIVSTSAQTGMQLFVKAENT